MATWSPANIGPDRVLVLAAGSMVGPDEIVVALGVPPLLLGVLLVLAPLCAVRGSFSAGRETSIGYGLHWATFGLSVGLAIVGMVSYGMFYLLALPRVAAIATPPNRSPHLRFVFRYLGGRFVAFLAVAGAIAVA